MGGEMTTKSLLRGPSGMRAEHIKGWMAKARNKEKEEAATAQKSVEEGMMALLRGTGGEDTEERPVRHT